MRRIIAIATAGVVILVLVVAQLVLPAIATDRLRDRLNKSGNVISVEVHAFPAIKLLWNHADRVVVRMGRYQSGAGALGDLLGQTADVGSVDASAQEFNSGLLTVRRCASAVTSLSARRSSPSPTSGERSRSCNRWCRSSRRTGASR